MKKKLVFAIHIFIILISAIFTYTVVTAAAGNSCLEIWEQYLNFRTKVIADRLETGIKAGLDIDNYYGLDAEAERAALFDRNNISAVILNSSGEPVAANFDLSAEKLAPAFAALPYLRAETGYSDVMGKRIFSQPFKTDSGIGHILLIYEKSYFSHIGSPFLIAHYRNTVDEIASLALNDLSRDVNSFHNKGLDAEDIAAMEDSFNSRFSAFQLIDSISMGYDKDGRPAFSTSDGSFNVNVNINHKYLDKTCLWIFLSLLAAFIICIMIVVEFMPLGRISSEWINNGSINTIPTLIRFISFFVYLAVYTSLPYGAVIINSMGESVLGLPVSVSASLPITLEAAALLAVLSVSPIIFKKTGIKGYAVLTGTVTVIPSFICFIFTNIYTIIICSVFLGAAQGLIKYLMNYLISICSKTPEDISVNYGHFNIGVLTGITVGGSLGGITAAQHGYNSVYMVSAVIMLVIIIIALLFMPYEYIKSVQTSHVSEKKYSYASFLTLLAKSPVMLLNMVFSVGVIAVALMYIVAFMPAALNLKGLSPMVSTYGFLIYGAAGNYISGYALKKARNMKRKTAAFVSLLIITLAVLVIIPSINALTIFAASFLAGLFDGCGAPSVTSALMNIKKARETDSALMLTGTALISGVGNIAAPVIYGVILYSGNIRVNLSLLAVFFLFSGIYIMNMKE